MQLTSFVETAGLAERLKEAVEEDLRLSLFVARDVFLTPGGELGKFVGIRHGPFVAQSVCRVSKDCAPASAAR
jgi:hypothetical protein